MHQHSNHTHCLLEQQSWAGFPIQWYYIRYELRLSAASRRHSFILLVFLTRFNPTLILQILTFVTHSLPSAVNIILADMGGGDMTCDIGIACNVFQNSLNHFPPSVL